MEPPPEIPRERLWRDDPPGYVTRPEEGPNLFSLEVCHEGLFCGFGEKLEYLNEQISVFDNLIIDTWSNSKLDEILNYLGCLRDDKVHVYWLQSGKTMYEGILPLVTEADCMDMRMAAGVDKSQVIFVDHANFIRFIGADICKRPAFSRPADDGPSNAASSDIVRAHVNVESEGVDSESDSGSECTQFNLNPLRGRVFWEKVNAPQVHPPLFTKVMGRPKKNRRKAPEEKMKNGVKVLTKAGVKIHCSICGVPGHNKKGHMKFLQSLEEQQRNGIVGDDDDFDIPEIMQNFIPQTPDPRLDPSERHDHMVHMMRQEAAAHAPDPIIREPLPENQFVVAARDSLPQAQSRFTTATTAGRARAAASTGGSATAAHGGRARTATGTGTRATVTTAGRGRGRGRAGINERPRTTSRTAGNKRAADASTSASAQGNDDATHRRGYRTGPGTMYHMLFGDDTQQRNFPDLNEPINLDGM